jgi:hypothetical protein
MSRFDFKMSFDNIAIIASALIGSGVAALSDYSQKATSGAVVKLQTTLGEMLDMNVRTLTAVLLLMILGAALCFVFQPSSRQAGFAVGLSVVSVILTATPITQQSTPAGVPAGRSGSLSSPERYAMMSDSNIISDGLVLRVQGQPNLLRLNFDVNVKELPARPLGKITIKARELPSGKTWEWTTEQFERQTNFPVQFFYDVPASPGATAVEARLEAEHYIAATQQSRVAGGANQTKLSYTLEKSPLPNFLKGLLEQRSF